MKKFLLLFIFFSLSVVGLGLGATPPIVIDSISADSSSGEVSMRIFLPRGVGSGGALDGGNVHVYEDGRLVDYIKVRSSKGKEGLRLILAFDSSLSVSPRLLGEMKTTAKSILKDFRPMDRAKVMSFNGEIRERCAMTSDTSLIESSIMSVKRVGRKTRLYDAMYDGLSALSNNSEGRSAMILFTDGIDDGSSVFYDDVVARARKLGIPLSVVSDTKSLGKPGSLARLTGGEVIDVKSASCKKLYDKIFASVQGYYDISFISQSNSKIGKHVVEVRLGREVADNRASVEFEFAGGLGFSEFLKIHSIDPRLPFIVMGVLLFIIVFVYIARLMRKKPAEKEVHLKSKEFLGFEGSDDADYMFQERYSWISDHPAEFPDVLYAEAWLQRSGDVPENKILLLKRETIIGCSGYSHVTVDDDSVSDYHARVRRIEGGYYLYDLISDTGTYLNGKKLLMPRLLHDWDEIKVGNSIFVFRGVR